MVNHPSKQVIGVRVIEFPEATTLETALVCGQQNYILAGISLQSCHCLIRIYLFSIFCNIHWFWSLDDTVQMRRQIRARFTHTSRGTAFSVGLQIHPAKTQISLRVRAGWSESSLFAWIHFGSLDIHRVHCADWSWMRRPTLIFARRPAIL